MIKIQYYDGSKWVPAGEFCNEMLCWVSLGDDNVNYRTIDENGNILTDKSSLTSVRNQLLQQQEK
jgi:hypothetical protein